MTAVMVVILQDATVFGNDQEQYFVVEFETITECQAAIPLLPEYLLGMGFSTTTTRMQVDCVKKSPIYVSK